MNVQGSELSARRHTPVMNRLHGLWSLGGVAGAVVTVLASRADVSVSVHLTAVALALIGVLLFVAPGLLRADEPHEPHAAARAVVPAVTDPPSPFRCRGRRARARWCDGDAARVGERGLAAFRLSIDFDSSAGVASAGVPDVRRRHDHRPPRRRLGAGARRFGTLQRLALAVAGVGSVLATLVPVEGVAIIGFLIVGLGTSVLFPQLDDQAARMPGPAVPASPRC